MDLAEALGVGPGDVVALVGGGGKTSALYRLGRELAARGDAVVLSGTTRFTPPERAESLNLVMIELDGRPEALSAEGPWPRTVATGHGNKGRLLPVSSEWVDQLHSLRPGWTVILEADGSAMRPFKAPAAHEPVIPLSSSLVVPVVGIDAVGRPLDETHVHRPELVADLTGAAAGETVHEEMIATVLCHAWGGRKGLPPGARWVPLINKADTPEGLARAERLAELLVAAGAERAVIARLRAESPVVRVVARQER